MLLKQKRNDSCPESCNGKVKPQCSSLSSLTISFSLSLHMTLSILVSSFFLTTTANYVSKKFYIFNLQFHNFYSCVINFTFFSYLILLAFFVFIFYIVLIMKISRSHTEDWLNHSRKNHSRIYVENQCILEPILLYRVSKCEQTKEQGSEDCLWTHIFNFLRDYYKFFFFFLPKCKYNRIKLCYSRLQFVKETQISTVSNKWPNYIDYKILL